MQIPTFTAFLALTIAGAAALPGYGPAPSPTPVYTPPAPVKAPVYAPPAPPAPAKPVVVKPAAPVAPAPPTFNSQTNTCSSGSPYCCSPTNTGGLTGGTTCELATTQCDSTTICCNNNGQTGSSATQNCGGTNSLQQPIIFPGAN